LRIRLYKFYNEHKGKMFTVNHFFSEKVLKRTINNIIKRAENCIRAKRKLRRRRIAKKRLIIAINCPSRKQQGNLMSIKTVSVNF
jgi:hypothetical protein